MHRKSTFRVITSLPSRKESSSVIQHSLWEGSPKNFGRSLSSIVLLLLCFAVNASCGSGGSSGGSGTNPNPGSSSIIHVTQATPNNQLIVSLTQGPSGTLVFINGTTLTQQFTPTSQVTFGGIAVALVLYLSPTQLGMVVPFNTSSGALVPLPAGQYVIQVDGGQSLTFTVTDLPSNPNPPGTILNAVLPLIGQAYTSNRSALQSALTTYQASAADPAVTTVVNDLLALLPGLDAYVQNNLPNLATTLDSGTLALLEQILLAKFGYPLPALLTGASSSAAMAAAAESSQLPGSQFLSDRATDSRHHEIGEEIARFFATLCLVTVIGPPSRSAGPCALASLTTVVVAFHNFVIGVTSGVITHFLVAAGSPSAPPSSAIALQLASGDSTVLSAYIVTQKIFRLNDFGLMALSYMVSKGGVAFFKGLFAGLVNEPELVAIMDYLADLGIGKIKDEFIEGKPIGPPSNPQALDFVDVERKPPRSCTIFDSSGPQTITGQVCQNILRINGSGVALAVNGALKPGQGADLRWDFWINQSLKMAWDATKYGEVDFQIPGSTGLVRVTPFPLMTAPDGGTVQLTATLVDSQGIEIDPQPPFTWSSDNPVATIEQTGPRTVLATIHMDNPAAGTCATIIATVVGDQQANGFSHVALDGTTSVGSPCPPR